MSDQVRDHDPSRPDEIPGDATGGEPATTVRSVQRAIDIMTLFTDSSTSRAIGDVVSATGLAKTTVIRLLDTLETNGLLASTERGFVPGPGLWRWAFAIHQAWELPPAAQKLMHELVDENRETVNLYIRRGDVRICVAQQESPLPLRHVVRVGDQLPLWAGASSKILLSTTDAAAIRPLYTEADPSAPPVDVFLRDIERVKTDGYAHSHGEREAGLSAVAVPVYSAGGEVLAALSFSGPTARFPTERVPGLAEQLIETASAFTALRIDHPLRSSD